MPVTLSFLSSSPQANKRPNPATSGNARASMSETYRKQRPSANARLLWIVVERLHQVAASQSTAHFGQCLLLELPNPLARQVVFVADFLEGQLLLGPQAKSLAEDVGLDRAQLAQKISDFGR